MTAEAYEVDAGTSRVERVDRALGSLRAGSPEVRGAAVVSVDGFIIASALPEDVDEERVARTAAALLGAGERAAELCGGGMDQALVRGREGYVIVQAAGAEALLVVLTTAQARLGLVLIDVKRRAAELARIL